MNEHPFQVGQVLYRYEDSVDYYGSVFDDDRIGDGGGRVVARLLDYERADALAT